MARREGRRSKPAHLGGIGAHQRVRTAADVGVGGPGSERGGFERKDNALHVRRSANGAPRDGIALLNFGAARRRSLE